MKASWSKRTLYFKKPAGTSRGVMSSRDVWYLFLSNVDCIGIGECAPLVGLSIDNAENMESMLDSVCHNPKYFLKNPARLSAYPSIRFGLEMAMLDFENGGGQRFFDSSFRRGKDVVAINGLIWMGNQDVMTHQIEQKLMQGWRCLKLKIGALDFEKELSILSNIRKRFCSEQVALRVDANGAFTASNVEDRLERLAAFNLHSIEQPIKPGQLSLLQSLCKFSPVPIALDEELIGQLSYEKASTFLDRVTPQYLVLKPSLLGGFSVCERWIKLATERNIGWWVTSALESSVGLNAVAQWVGTLKTKGFQGLGTGQLFTNNLPSPLQFSEGGLTHCSKSEWLDVNKLTARWLEPAATMYVQTSGSTSEPKSIEVPKRWMRNSVKLTAQTFSLSAGDTALLCLPIQYIAGKMMVIRAIELGLRLIVVSVCKDPLKAVNEPVDFAAMVPGQLHTSIKLNRLGRVKKIIIGGSAINQSLAILAQTVKGTDLYETYGMTETLTHIAIRALNGENASHYLHPLSGVSIYIDDSSRLIVRTRHLDDQCFVTSDIVQLNSSNSFKILGRADEVINVGGIKLVPEVLENKLADILQGRQYIVKRGVDDKGHECVALYVEGEPSEFDYSLLENYEQPKRVYYVKKIKRTSSGKVCRGES